MKAAEYAKMDGVALAQGIGNGDYSGAEVVEACIDVIEILNPDLNAVVMKNFENARSLTEPYVGVPEKSRAEVFSKARPGNALRGVPFLLKDVNVFTHDMPTTFSCAFFRDALPAKDSEIVKRWRESGLIIMGKTNTPEFAEDFVCEPTFRGPTLNPWNDAVTVGGSSGGAGAAVASGMVPIAHGTDLGGSIRIPAACCGVFGLKPTSGLSPVDHGQSELASGFNSDHVLTRSVRDSAAALDATSRPILGYRYPVMKKVPSYLHCLNQPPQPMKIGVCFNTPMGEPVPAKQRMAVEKVSNILSDHGHELVSYDYPSDLEFGNWLDSLWMFDVVNELEKRIREVGRQPEPSELEAMTSYIRQRVSAMSAMDHYRARESAHRSSVKIMNSMSYVDLVLTPALGSDPVALGVFDSRTEAFDYRTWADQGAAFAPFSYVCNITGQPAASLPVQLETNQQPCAVQLAGHQGQDHLILQVSALLEEVLGWKDMHPPIWAGNL
ncbi:MAG: hypothetical protein GKR95_01825 [Gammaproteobacteria bacterium]|nr:hypothetical protein [Gammaproteobacteria bacterium]